MQGLYRGMVQLVRLSHSFRLDGGWRFSLLPYFETLNRGLLLLQ